MATKTTNKTGTTKKASAPAPARPSKAERAAWAELRAFARRFPAIGSELEAAITAHIGEG